MATSSDSDRRRRRRGRLPPLGRCDEVRARSRGAGCRGRLSGQVVQDRSGEAGRSAARSRSDLHPARAGRRSRSDRDHLHVRELGRARRPEAAVDDGHRRLGVEEPPERCLRRAGAGWESSCGSHGGYERRTSILAPAASAISSIVDVICSSASTLELLVIEPKLTNFPRASSVSITVRLVLVCTTLGCSGLYRDRHLSGVRPAGGLTVAVELSSAVYRSRFGRDRERARVRLGMVVPQRLEFGERRCAKVVEVVTGDADDRVRLAGYGVPAHPALDEHDAEMNG